MFPVEKSVRRIMAGEDDGCTVRSGWRPTGDSLSTSFDSSQSFSIPLQRPSGRWMSRIFPTLISRWIMPS